MKEEQCDIQTFVEHLTRDSVGPSSNPSLVRHYFSYSVTFVISQPLEQTDNLLPGESAWGCGYSRAKII